MDQKCFDSDNEGNRILADMRIDGNVKSEESICLDGFVNGNVYSAKQVILNKGGVIDGNVDCEELYTEGLITGNVCVIRKTVMGVDAVIKGGLITASLEITPGAKLGGGLELKKALK